MTKKKRKRRYPGPWRLVRTEPTGKFEVYLQRGSVEVRTFKTLFYKRKIGPGVEDSEFRKEVVNGPSLSTMMTYLKIQDKQANILLLMEAGLGLLGRLVERFEYYQDAQEEKRRQLRKRAYAKKKLEWAEKRLQKSNRQMREENQFCRRLEV